MKILITGCNGQLGTELQKQLSVGYSELGDIPAQLKDAEVIPIDIDVLDLSEEDEVRNYVLSCKPDVIFNCAAYTNVDGCETNKELAYKANALGPKNLALAAKEINAKLIHISTDYVFDGKDNDQVPRSEEDVPNPISAYGNTKLAGETFVQDCCTKYFIVRTAWLYSYYGKNFVKTIVNAGRKYGTLEVVNDQYGNPTNAEDLAHVLLWLSVTENYGIYHCTGEGVCSWYDFASEIICLSGVKATVSPCTTQEYKTKHPESADRPLWSALENRKLKETIGSPMRNWEDALASFFDYWDGNNGIKGITDHGTI